MFFGPHKNLESLIRARLGQPLTLSPQRRLDEACMAAQLRNFFFTATAPILPYPSAFPQFRTAVTPAFHYPLVVTNVLSSDELGAGPSNTYTFADIRVTQYGGDATPRDAGYGTDWYGLDIGVPQQLLISHISNNNTLLTADSFWRHRFVPRMLKPNQVLKTVWTTTRNTVANDEDLTLQLGFQAVRALKDERAVLSQKDYAALCRFVERNPEPETFFLNALLPRASIPTPGQSVRFQTDPHNRPLLIYGISCTFNGAQIQFWDDSDDYHFCWGATTSPSVGEPTVNDVPYWLVMPNADQAIGYDTYNMLPVPHLLKPEARLVFKITNGLRPGSPANYGANTFINPIDSKGACVCNILGTTDLRIALLCRTV